MNYDRHDGTLMQRLALKDDLPSNDLAGGQFYLGLQECLELVVFQPRCDFLRRKRRRDRL